MSAGAQSLTKLKGPDEAIIKKGQAAPFFGVLTPEERYRLREEQLEICDIFKDTRPLPPECPDCTEGWFWTSVALLSVGFAGGVLLRAP